MSWLTRLEQYFEHELWARDLEALHGFERLGTRMLRLGAAAVWSFQDRVLSTRATGLVYTTLLSLVPFLAVTFSVLKAFGVHLQIEPLLAQALLPLGPKGEEITSQVIGFVTNIRVGVLGSVGVAALFVTTFMLIDQIEDALNVIWRVHHGRPWARKFTDYLSVVLVGPVLIFTAIALTASAESSWLVQRVREIQPLGSLFVLGANLVPFLIVCGVFTFLYKLVPYTKVQLSSALVGGITAGVLWHIAEVIFAAFVVGSARYSAIYSSFAIMILFFFWLYVCWLIVLAGAQIAYFHQHPSAYLTPVLWRQGTHTFREQLALRALLHLTRRYLDGQPPYRPTELATMLNVPLSILEGQIDEFVRRGIVCRTTAPDGITLVRAPEQVSLVEVLDMVSSRELMAADSRQEKAGPITNLLRRRDEVVERALAGMTLKSLAETDTQILEPDTPAPRIERVP